MAVPLVAALAFLLASFPARNSDLWAHLAAGRLLAGGDLSAATAPPPAPEGGVGQGWLYDLVSFAAYSAFGGAGLVVCKALLVAGLALVLLRLSWAGQGWWWPAVCTTLALLAMSTRLLLQPATVSCLFLALALWFVRPRGETSAGPLPLLPPWPLLVLFAVWANVDGWFLIGLAVVALDGLGQLADRAAAHRGRPDRLPSAFLLSSSPRLLTWLAVLAAVCLLNPSHVHAFSLPAELRWSGPAETSSAWGRIASPFQAAYFETLGRTPAGLAYFPLLGLGLLSFFLNLPRWHWRWSLPWLGLAVLSAFQARAVPFFAVVAGPVLAWNLQELLSRRVPAEVRQQLTWQQGAVVGRVLAVALGLALLACAWPGWLQAPPFEPRRWAVQTAPSLARGGEVARLWHEEGRLGPDACGLHLAPETAHALAWFCPGEKRLLDDALAAAVRGDGAAPADWRERLRAAGVNHVYVYDPDRGRLFEVLNALLANPGEWPLLHREGDLAVFGWRDPAAGQAADPFDGWKMDVGRLAFHPAAEKKAPRRPADREPEPRRWADALWKPAPPRPLDRDEATLHLFHAEALRRSAPGRHQRVWEASQSAAFVGAAWGWTGAGLPLAADLLNARVRAALVRPLEPEDGSGIGTLPIPDQGAHVLRRPFVANRDDTPPALLFLAIRSARRALAANPEDAQACLVLGESYLRLLNSTRERVWAGRLPELAQLRHAQASAALNRAVALRPDLAQAHLSLGGLYREQGYLDLALLHFRNYLDRTRAAGPPPGVSAEAFREQEKQLREELTWMAKDVEARGNRYAKEAGGLPVLERARLAMRLGLAGKARDLLLESHISAFGPRGMALELDLLLATGRPKDVRDWIAPEHRAALGATSYHWLRAQALAALGDYESAREECNEMNRSLAQGPGRDPVRFREVMALLVGQTVLGDQPFGGIAPYEAQRTFGRMQFQGRATGLARNLKREADTTVIRGLLALEEGDVEEAEVAFRTALALWKDEASAASGGGLDFNGRVVAQGCLEWLK